MRTNYYLNQIARAEKDHDPIYCMTITLRGTKGESNCLNITPKQLEQIKSIFKKVKA